MSLTVNSENKFQARERFYTTKLKKENTLIVYTHTHIACSSDPCNIQQYINET